MKIRAWLASIFGVIYLLFLALCSLSGPMSADSPLAFLNHSIYLSTGGYPEDTTEISAVLTEDDLPLLESFPELRSVDFSGSSCYDAIIAWEAKHPEIAVKYTVELSDSLTVDNAVTELDMPAISDADMSVLQERLAFLPAVKSVDLGSGTAEEHIDFDTLAALVSRYPETDFSYYLKVLGQDVTLEVESIDLSAMTKEDMASILPLLGCMPKLKNITLGTEGSYALGLEDIAQLVAARPEADFSYSGTVWGVGYTLMDTSLDLNHIKMDDEGAAVRKVIACMNKLETLDMDYCGVSNGAMEAIRADFPKVNVIWRIWFGEAYSVRTDVLKILASKPSVGGLLDSEDVSVLKYCTKVKYLDLGHNGDGGDGIQDISFTAYMPDLEVCVLSLSGATDISPLANCHKLEYLELYSTKVSDISALSELTSLHHLNIQSVMNLTDISPIYGLTNLERLWIGCDTPIPPEQVEEFKSRVPNCQVNTTDSVPDSWKWRSVDLNIPKYDYVERYLLVRFQFGYQVSDYSFYWLDPKCGDPAPPQHAGKYGYAASNEPIPDEEVLSSYENLVAWLSQY